MLARINNVDFHLGVELEASQKLWCDKEILTCAFLARNVDHAFMYHALIPRVHTLIDFVNDTEGRLGEILQGHQVEDRGDGTFATRLTMRVENTERLVFTV